MARQVRAFAKDDGRLSLYNQGLTDIEIAEKMYLHPGSVYGWRHRRGLKANGGTTLRR